MTEIKTEWGDAELLRYAARLYLVFADGRVYHVRRQQGYRVHDRGLINRIIQNGMPAKIKAAEVREEATDVAD